MNQGGRVGYQTGGISTNLVDPRMKNTLAQNVQNLSTAPRAANRLAMNIRPVLEGTRPVPSYQNQATMEKSNVTNPFMTGLKGYF